MSQLGEEEVRREASSQPGEAAQDGELRKAGDGAPGWWKRGRTFTTAPVIAQEDERDHEDDEDEEDGWRNGGDIGEEKGEHGCKETGEKEEAERSPAFNVAGRDLEGAGGRERVYLLRQKPWCYQAGFHGNLEADAAAACFRPNL